MQWFTTGVSTTLVLILLGIVSFFILFAQRLSDSVKENLTVTVLLDGEASRSDIHEFRRALTDERYVYALDYVGAVKSLGRRIDRPDELGLFLLCCHRYWIAIVDIDRLLFLSTCVIARGV